MRDTSENKGTEGDDPGECTDGIDNDDNGAVDCDDSMCANGPDCGGGDGGLDGSTNVVGNFDNHLSLAGRMIAPMSKGYSRHSTLPLLNKTGECLVFASHGDGFTANLEPGDRKLFFLELSQDDIELIGPEDFRNIYQQFLASLISDDCNKVVFESSEHLDPNIPWVQDAYFENYIFMWDRTSKTTHLVSPYQAVDDYGGSCEFPSLAPDGSMVAFISQDEWLIQHEFTNPWEVFIQTIGENDPKWFKLDGLDYSYSKVQEYLRISADGTHLAMIVNSNELGLATESYPTFIVADIATGEWEAASRRADGSLLDFSTYFDKDYFSISGDGRYLVFIGSGAGITEEMGDDENMQIFLRDLESDTTTLVTKSATGEPGNGESFFPNISGDGRYIVFESQAANLLDGVDGLIGTNIIRYDVQTGEHKLISRGLDGEPVDQFSDCEYPSINYDGSVIAFWHYLDDTNLVANHDDLDSGIVIYRDPE